MKLRILAIAFTLAITTLIISCFCKETKVPHVLMENISVVNCDNENLISEGVEVNSRDFRINLRIGGRLTAINNLSIPFINMAYATSCDPGDGVRGLKYKIVNFEIYCTDDILGINSGENLALPNLMKVYYQWGSKKIEMNITEWIENINNNEGFANYSRWNTPFRHPNQSLYFYFNEEFTTTSLVFFKVHIELDNGQTFDSETASLKLL